MVCTAHPTFYFVPSWRNRYALQHLGLEGFGGAVEARAGFLGRHARQRGDLGVGQLLVAAKVDDVPVRLAQPL